MKKSKAKAKKAHERRVAALKSVLGYAPLEMKRAVLVHGLLALDELPQTKKNLKLRGLFSDAIDAIDNLERAAATVH